MNQESKGGRKRKFSTEQLINVIRSYVDTEKYITKLTYISLAKFAKESMDYTNIVYNDFMRNPEVKKVIHEFNEKRSLVCELKTSQSSELTFVSFEVDEFVDRYQKNIKLQRVLLHKFNENYKKAFNEVKRYSKEIKNMHGQIEELNNKLRRLSEINKVLRLENNELKHYKTINKKKEKSERKIEMYSELLRKGLISSLEGEDLINFINTLVGEKINDLVELEDAEVKKKTKTINSLKEENEVKKKTSGIGLAVDATVSELLNVFDE
jgi:hypothetical protein